MEGNFNDLIKNLHQNDLRDIISFLVMHPEYTHKLNTICDNDNPCNKHDTISSIFNELFKYHKILPHSDDIMPAKITTITIKKYFDKFYRYHDWNSLYIKSLIDINDLNMLSRKSRILTIINKNLYIIDRQSYTCHSNDITTNNIIYNRHITYKEEKSNEYLALKMVSKITSQKTKNTTNTIHNILSTHFLCYITPNDMLYLIKNHHGLRDTSLMLSLYKQYPIFMKFPHLNIVGNTKAKLKSMIANVINTKTKIVNGYKGLINKGVNKTFNLMDSSISFEIKMFNKFIIPYFQRIFSLFASSSGIKLGFINKLLDHICSLGILDQKTLEDIKQIKLTTDNIEFQIDNMSNKISNINDTISDYTDHIININSLSLLFMQASQLIAAPTAEIASSESGAWGGELVNSMGMVIKTGVGIFISLKPILDIMNDVSGIIGSLTKKYDSLLQMDTDIRLSVKVFINDLPEEVRSSLVATATTIKSTISSLISSINDMISDATLFDAGTIARSLDVVNRAINDPSLVLKTIFGVIDFGKLSGIPLISDTFDFMEQLILSPDDFIDKLVIKLKNAVNDIEGKLKFNIHSDHKLAKTLLTIASNTPIGLLLRGVGLTPQVQIAEDVIKDITERLTGIIHYFISILINDMDMFNKYMKIKFVQDVHQLNMGLYYGFSQLYEQINGKTPTKDPVGDKNLQIIFNVNMVPLRILVPLTIMLIELDDNLVNVDAKGVLSVVKKII